MFKIENFEDQYTENNGRFSIKVKVDGFWSTDTISLYVDRNKYLDDFNWSVSMSTASGGIETGFDQIQAYKNYGHAMIAASDLAQNIDFVKCEAGYQNYFENDYKPRMVAEDAARKVREDLLTADVPLTKLQLKAAMNFIKATGKSIVVRPRHGLQGHKLKIEYSDRWYCHTFSTDELGSVRSVYNTAAALASRIVGEHGSRYSADYEIL